jgi:hypothetical protein
MATILVPGDYTVPQPPPIPPPDTSWRNPHLDLCGIEMLPCAPPNSGKPLGTWIQPGDTGGTGGGTSLPHGTWTSALNPDGSRRWVLQPVKRPQGQPWDTFYWYTRRFLSTPRYESYTYNGQFHIADPQNWEAIETDMEEVNDTHDAIDLGSQYRIGSGQPVFHIWDYNKKWVPVPSVKLTADMFTKPVVFSLRATADWTALTMTVDGLLLNGTWYPIGMATGTTKKPGASYGNFAWQFDSKGTGLPGIVDWKAMEQLVA